MKIKNIGSGYLKLTPDKNKRIRIKGDEKTYKTAIVKMKLSSVPLMCSEVDIEECIERY